MSLEVVFTAEAFVLIRASDTAAEEPTRFVVMFCFVPPEVLAKYEAGRANAARMRSGVVGHVQALVMIHGRPGEVLLATPFNSAGVDAWNGGGM